MKLTDLLSEAPLADIEYVKGKGSSLSDTDKKIFDHNVLKKTYHERLKNLPIDLYVYILDDEALTWLGQTFPEQQLIIKKNRANQDVLAATKKDNTKTAFNNKIFKVVLEKIKENKLKNSNAVHFVMGDNFSPQEQRAPTPWMIVHRFVHAISDKFNQRDLTFALAKIELLVKKTEKPDIEHTSKYYDYGKLFTFKSARDGKITDNELSSEIMTEYLLTGKVKFQPGVEVDDQLKKAVPEVESIKKVVDDVIEQLTGKIFYV